MCNVKEAVKLIGAVKRACSIAGRRQTKLSNGPHFVLHRHFFAQEYRAIGARFSMPPYVYPGITGMHALPRLSELVREAVAVRRVASPIAWL